MPKIFRPRLSAPQEAAGPSKGQNVILQYFASRQCAACSALCGPQHHDEVALCWRCQQDPQRTTLILTDKVRRWDRTLSDLRRICRECCGFSVDNSCCFSLDCPTVYKSREAKLDAQQIDYVQELLQKLALTF